MSAVYTPGGLVSLIDPSPKDIRLEDMAGALAKICRFAGNTPHMYSVAQHSLNLAQVVPDQYRLHALLHDAHEAYIGDITRPVANMARPSAMGRIIGPISDAVTEAFNLTWDTRAIAEVLGGDDRMLATEFKYLLEVDPVAMGALRPPYDQGAGLDFTERPWRQVAADWLAQVEALV